MTTVAVVAPTRPVRVLLVEDDPDDRLLAVEALRDVESTDYEITWVDTASRAVDALRCADFDVALLDFHLGSETGLDVLRAFEPGHLATPCVVLTGERDREIDLAVMAAGAVDYFVKHDLTSPAIERTIRYAIERASHLRGLAASEARFRTVVETATDAILLTTDVGSLLSWNAAAIELFGLDPSHADRTRIGELIVGRGTTPADLQARSDATPLLGRRRDGSTFPLALSLASWEAPEGRLWSAIVRDVTAQRELEERLAHQAFHDPLTQLANRALFANRVEHALVRLRRRPGAVGVLFFDLDDFKRVNDSCGHAVGDTLLVSVAERVLGCVRSNDTVARLGGDEFAVLVEDAEDPRTALVVADRIMRAMAPPFDVADTDLHVSCSIGVAVSTNAAATGIELLRDADLAMYAAKAQGKSCIQLFEDRMHAAIMERVTVEADLRGAVDRGEIVVHYQPILDLTSGRIKGFEALARWNHPTRGLLAPAAFIDIAESNGLIVPIGRSVLDQACRQLRAWQLEHAGGAALTLSVNLSSRQIEDAGIVGHVDAALRESGLEPSCLVLEITESLVVSRTTTSLERLAKIAELGVRLAIDDFGTGYSSLSYLQDLPLSIVKVDRSFVDRIGDPRGGALVEAIVAMSRSLGLATIAEGIETSEQRAAVERTGCVLGQGYLFARPLEPAAVASLLAAGPAVTSA